MEEKLKYQNYNPENGDVVKKSENSNFILTKIKTNICNSCENENDTNNNYCKFCGESLNELQANKRYNESKEDKNNSVEFLQKLNLGNIFKTSLFAVFILFFISCIFKLVVGSGLDELSSFLNPIHIILGLNLAYLDISSINILGNGNIFGHLGLLLLLIIPVISIILSNIIFMRKKNKCANDVLINSLGTGILYGVILLFLSFFSKVSINEMLQYGIAIKISYKPFSVFVNGFIIAFLVTYLINFKRKYYSENIYLAILKKAISIIFTGYIVVLLILIVITLNDRSYLYEFGMYGYVNDLSIGVILSQLSAYMWGFANFIPIAVSNTTVSIFNLLGLDLFIDTKLIFIIMIALGALILLVNGCNLKRKYKNSNINVVLIFSLYYALIMGILALFSSIIINGNLSFIELNNYQGSLILGIPFMGAVINSFIYSFILTLIGYKLYVFEEECDINI